MAVSHKRLCAAFAVAFFSFSIGANAAQPARGFIPSSVAAESRWESIVAASPSEAQAARDELGLASYVHRMGQPGDLRSARYVRDELARAGWNAHLVEYVVPVEYPTTQRLTVLQPRPENIDLNEPEIAGDVYSRDHRAIGKPYSGFSPDGDVTGQLIYANRATAADFKVLADLHVDVRGAILIARVGGGALTAKAFEGAKHGAKAVLIFPDPPNASAMAPSAAYPNGPLRPLGAALRNTMLFTNDPGDPTAIGVPVPGAPHKPLSSIKLPSIPEMPITALVAQTLLKRLYGPGVPAGWQPVISVDQHVGGSARAHFVIRSHRSLSPVWDVIATMQGTDPAQMVVVGGHRDAWTYGAVDPISGTVDMLQLGRAFGKLKNVGWKPQRTIVIGSWDGEELNLFGSDEWVVQHEHELRAGLVAYINTDEVAFGQKFGIYATPDLAGFMRDVTTAVRAPDSSPLDAYWKAQDAARTVDPVGGGSDHEPFVFHENLPGAGAGFGGPFGTYHSAYDDPASLRVFDPGMHRAAAAARYTSLAVLRLSDAAYPDLRLADLAQALIERVDAFRVAHVNDVNGPEVGTLLAGDARAYAQAARALDDRANRDVSAGNRPQAFADFKRLRASEAAFFDASTAQWQRSLLYDLNGAGAGMLPTLESFNSDNSAQVVARLDAAFKAATQAASLGELLP